MRARSKIWSKLAARGYFSVDAKAIINGVEFTQISAPKIDRQTMQNAMQIGNCCNASLEFSVLPEPDQVIPNGAEVIIKARLFNESTKKVSEWLEFGTFFIDAREDGYEGLVKIKAYDAMLKIDQNFVADDSYNTLGWPLPMKTVVEMIAARIGVTVDPRTQIKTGADYVCDLPNNLTVRQVLSGIACCHGGNWIITEENQLRLVPLVQVPDVTYKIISADYEDIIVPNNNTLIWNNANDTPVADLTNCSVAKVAITDKARKDYHIVDKEGQHIKTQDGYTLIWAKDGEVYAVNGLINVPVVMGTFNTGDSLVVSNIVASRTVTYTKIKISDQSGTDGADVDGSESTDQSVTTTFYARNGTSAGTTLNAGDCPYMTQQICDDLYSEFAGLVYSPYTVTKTVYDPATEIGDQIKIGENLHSVIYNTSITLNVAFTADLSIPEQPQTSSEYPYNGVEAQIRDTNIKLQSQILRLDNSITLKVKAVADDLDETRDNVAKVELAVSPEGIGSTISAMAGTISLTAGKLLITSGNFLLDKNGNVTINNGYFKGTVDTGTDSDGFSVHIGNGSISLTSEGTNYLRIIPSHWGRGSDPNVEPGTQLRANNYLYIADPNGNQCFAVITCDQINGLQEGVHCFSPLRLGQAGGSSNTMYLGWNELFFGGNYVEFDCGVHASNFVFTSPPISSSKSTSLSYLLSTLWNKVFG